MRPAKVLLIVVGVLIVVIGGFIAFTPIRHVSLDYGTQLAERAAEAGSSTAGAPVPNLTDIGQLQAAFNAGEGSPRLIMLISPT